MSVPPVMSSRSLLLLAALLPAVTPTSLQLPDYIKPCKQNDPKLNECVVRNGRQAIPKFLNGDAKYRVPRLEPLDIKELKVHQGGTKQLGLSMVLKDCKVTGLSQAQFLAARTDLAGRHIEWDLEHPYITILGRYEVSGKVLVLPIRGRGTANITLTNMKTVFKFNFELERRGDGEEYMKLTNTDLSADIGRAYFRFNNLFNGDRLLGETMNRFLNDNWKEVVKELGAPVIDSISHVFEIILDRIAELVPYNQIYLPS